MHRPERVVEKMASGHWAAFQPEELDLLDAAFDAACAEFVAARGTIDGAPLDERIRSRLAEAIIWTAASGERDPAALKAAALRAVD